MNIKTSKWRRQTEDCPKGAPGDAIPALALHGEQALHAFESFLCPCKQGLGDVVFEFERGQQ
jgi:hypothetical protein